MKILLTGATGFIGRNLYEGLSRDYELFAPSHKELDLLDRELVRKYIISNKINVVIHTAVKGGDNVFESTLKMFMSIYRCLDVLDRFISFGSGAEYGKLRDLNKVKEESLGQNIPIDDYGLSKLICSLISKNNKKIVTLIPFGIFGKYEDYRCKFISNSIVKNLIGLPIKIKQDVKFDYLYIDDFIPVVNFFINHLEYYGDYNVTPNKSICLSQIVKIINKVGLKESKIIIDNSGLNYQYTGSNEKLNKAMNKLRFCDYKESISSLYDYYSENLSKLDEFAIIEDKYYLKSKIKQ